MSCVGVGVCLGGGGGGGLYKVTPIMLGVTDCTSVGHLKHYGKNHTVCVCLFVCICS